MSARFNSVRGALPLEPNDLLDSASLGIENAGLLCSLVAGFARGAK
jgi:hypothetical protein